MRPPIPEHLRRLTREQTRRIAALIERAVADERAACARIADTLAGRDGGIAREIAYRIRARCGEDRPRKSRWR